MQSASRRSLLPVATAYHEAGHVVVAEVLGRRVHSARIDCRGGLVRNAKSPRLDLRRQPRTLRERWAREREVIIYFAGLIAEERFSGKRTLDGVESDFLAIEKILGARSGRKEETIAYGRWLYERSASLVLEHWSIIARVAKELMKLGQLRQPQIRRLTNTIKIRKA